MIDLIEDQRESLTQLCNRYQVRCLEVFGSAAGDDFDQASSDLDFLVEFQDLKPGEHADAYFGLLESLQELFDRTVDLVMISAIKNPYFLESVNQSRTVLYAA